VVFLVVEIVVLVVVILLIVFEIVALVIAGLRGGSVLRPASGKQPPAGFGVRLRPQPNQRCATEHHSILSEESESEGRVLLIPPALSASAPWKLVSAQLRNPFSAILSRSEGALYPPE